MDSAKSHLGDVLEFFKKYNAESKIIDVGLTPLLQFLDTLFFKFYFIFDLRREAKAIIHLQNRLSVTISAQITTKT